METVVSVAEKHNRTKLPKIVWRNGSHSLSSGHFSKKSRLKNRRIVNRPRIVITAGTTGKDHLPVLLHELAHWLSPRDRGHGKSFWKKAFDLYEEYNISQDYLEREFKYMKTAKKVYMARTKAD